MSGLACPQCTQPIGDQSNCSECGLDATLLLQVRESARALARTAAQYAADGNWQSAYDTAAESLLLQRYDNDLAAFVLLTASVAGARGSIRDVPHPRSEALPDSVAPHADDLVATADRLRSLGEQSSSSGEIDQELQGLDPQHPFLSPPVPSQPVLSQPAPVAVAASTSGPSFSPLLATAAVVMALFLGGGAGWWNGERIARRQYENQPPPAAVDLGVIAAAQPPAPPVVAPAPPRMQVPDVLRAEAYRRGRDASKHGQYDRAREFLEFAVEAPNSSWYWDHALFYLGKAYHRLDRREDAVAAYRRLEREAPRSVYLADARILLARAENGQGVER